MLTSERAVSKAAGDFAEGVDGSSSPARSAREIRHLGRRHGRHGPSACACDKGVEVADTAGPTASDHRARLGQDHPTAAEDLDRHGALAAVGVDKVCAVIHTGTLGRATGEVGVVDLAVEHNVDRVGGSGEDGVEEDIVGAIVCRAVLELDMRGRVDGCAAVGAGARRVEEMPHDELLLGHGRGSLLPEVDPGGDGFAPAVVGHALDVVDGIWVAEGRRLTDGTDVVRLHVDMSALLHR